jgi:acetyl esterase/lipase
MPGSLAELLFAPTPMKSPSSLAVIFLSLIHTVAVSAALPTDRPVIPLWPNGAPGSEARRTEPEKITGANVSNVHQPTLTIYLPSPATATGGAIIVVPGGGHAKLCMGHEGHNVGQWLADHGIAAFILKHRLAKDDATPAGTPQPYTIERDAVADGQRALRLVRSRAAEWGINPATLGMVGFSAGGEVVAFTAMRAAPGDPTAADPIDRQSARPDYQALIYPGKSGQILPTKGAPPAFLAAGFSDRPDISEGLAELYLRFKRVGVPADLHIYAGAGHGFGVRESNASPAGAWPQRLLEWLVDQKFISAKGVLKTSGPEQ